METHRSYNAFHLGDNLVHLHFLRHLALANPGHSFRHGIHECHRPQLSEALTDVPQIELVGLPDVEREGAHRWRNVWKNADGFWERHPQRASFASFHLDWFRHLAGEMGLASPFQSAADLLFDYPALTPGTLANRWDFLIVNSQPCSGQVKGFDSIWYFEPLIADLVQRGYRVMTTAATHVPGVFQTYEHNWSISKIGHHSQFIPHHILLATGPMWPTLNRFSLDAVQTRIVLLDHVLGPELIDVLPHSYAATPGTISQVRTLADVRAVLKEKEKKLL